MLWLSRILRGNIAGRAAQRAKKQRSYSD